MLSIEIKQMLDKISAFKKITPFEEVIVRLAEEIERIQDQLKNLGDDSG